MDYKELYQAWLDKSGGMNAAIEKAYKSYKSEAKDESVVKEQAAKGYFKPGSLYTFDYVDLALVDKMNKGNDVPFFDGHPYIVALDYDKQFQYGLNLNLFPMNIRIEFFTALLKQYGEVVEYNIGKEQNAWRPLNGLNRQSVFKLIPRMKNNMAINKYDIRLMRKVNVIKWESVIPASTLYMKYNMLFNKKKNMDMRTIIKSMF